MAKTKTVRVTDEELLLLEAARNNAKASDAPATATEKVALDAQKQLANAFVEAIERTRPVEKKTAANRKPQTPWSPKPGEAKVKMKRKFFHHGLLIGENVNNATITLLNQVRPGSYCEGWVRVILRKDRGIDVDYPIRTASQRLKLVNQFGIRNFDELLQRIIDEHTNPKNYRRPDDIDLYEENV